jgi:hypothetical protein
MQLTSSDSQTIYLLERYASAHYFEELLNIWQAFVVHNEKCLDRFMNNLPPDLCSRPLSEQVDIVWGGTVIPNFRDTLQSLDHGYRLLAAGDYRGLRSANSPLNDLKGQSDFWSAWMSSEEESRYSQLLGEATLLATNIATTDGAFWKPNSLAANYNPETRGALSVPDHLPFYRLDQSISVRTGDTISVPGVYVPDTPHSSAQFLTGRFSAPKAIVLVESDHRGLRQITEKVDCVWRKVVRSTHSSDGNSMPDNTQAGDKLVAGLRCTRAGYYFSPAKVNSRREFGQGDLAPDLGSNYGQTIWQWGADQTDHLVQ